MKDTFSSAELTALRNDLIHDVLVDSREAAELLQLFLTGRGFGASPEVARDAVGRVVTARRRNRKNAKSSSGQKYDRPFRCSSHGSKLLLMFPQFQTLTEVNCCG